MARRFSRTRGLGRVLNSTGEKLLEAAGLISLVKTSAWIQVTVS
jgi:hypothetical protein